MNALAFRVPHDICRRELVDRKRIRFPCPRYRKDFEGFCRDILGYDPWEKQREVADRIIEGVSRGTPFRVLLYGGHKWGKSRLLASVVLWWFCCWEDAVISVVLPTERQLLAILWKEISILHKESGLCIQCREDERKTKTPKPRPCPHSACIDGTLYRRPNPEGLVSSNRHRTVFGNVAKDVKKSAGYSGPRVLYVIDEGAGINKDLVPAIEGNLGGVVNGGILFAGNPIDINSYFGQEIEKAKRGKGRFALVHASSWETPNAKSKQNLIEGMATWWWCNDMLENYGEKHWKYIERVIGEHAPKEAGSLITSADYYRAKLRYEPSEREGTLYLGIDIAGGSGGDISVIAPRQGAQMWPLVIVPDTLDVLAQEVETVIRSTGEDVVINYDALGIGQEFSPYLRAITKKFGDRVKVHPLVMNASGGQQYAMFRDYLYASFAEAVKGWLAVPEDEDLEEEALNLQYDKNPEKQHRYGFGKDRIEPKPMMRKKLGRSPDHLDAACYSLANDDHLPTPVGRMDPDEVDKLEAEDYVPAAPVTREEARMRRFAERYTKGRQ